MTEIELLDKSFKLIRDGLIFGEVIHKEHVESFLQENERKINELQAENERLKSELQQTATKCNKLKCLALHAMSEYFGYKTLSSYKKKMRAKYGQFANKFYFAYRKAKKALRKGK